MVDLPQVVPYTGEEQETTIALFKVRLYRFKEDEWKERGIGRLKFLKHLATSRVRVVMRANKTGYLILNHNLIKNNTLCELSKWQTQDKAWLWQANDFSDGSSIIWKLCAKFTSDEAYESFSIEFNKACEENKVLSEQEEEGEGEGEGEEATDELCESDSE